MSASQSEGLEGLGSDGESSLGGEPKRALRRTSRSTAEAPAAEDVGDESDGISSSAEMLCTACKCSSKSHDPIAKKKRLPLSKATRLAWGKTTTRKIVNKRGLMKKIQRRCGEWCRYCFNVAQRHLKRKKPARWNQTETQAT